MVILDVDLSPLGHRIHAYDYVQGPPYLVYWQFFLLSTMQFLSHHSAFQGNLIFQAPCRVSIVLLAPNSDSFHIVITTSKPTAYCPIYTSTADLVYSTPSVSLNVISFTIISFICPSCDSSSHQLALSMTITTPSYSPCILSMVSPMASSCVGHSRLCNVDRAQFTCLALNFAAVPDTDRIPTWPATTSSSCLLATYPPSPRPSAILNFLLVELLFYFRPGNVKPHGHELKNPSSNSSKARF
mmetsp:Transcript_21484/g.29543  ORF Transcript_21484/g.29543 Transcript_21484/m.29543 type:complete len:242 (-) Transcript_21484:23-748(-)